jgi:hypothetical protein
LPNPTFAEAVGVNPTASTAATAEAQIVFRNVLDMNFLPVHFVITPPTKRHDHTAEWQVLIFPWSAVGAPLSFSKHPLIFLASLQPPHYISLIVAFSTQPKLKTGRLNPCGDLSTDSRQRYFKRFVKLLFPMP